MIHAYREIYLSKAQAVLGDAFDYAINRCAFSGEDFIKLFSASYAGKCMENGEPAYIAGKSGAELVIEIVAETKGEILQIELQESYERSKEYWLGWAIAYYQWYSNRKYGEIFKAVSYEELQRLYYTLHEADVAKFAEIMESHIRELYPDTNLKHIRSAYGYSQSELAKESGVSLRSIQMYEQRNKNINKASADTILALAKTLGCTMEDLMENSRTVYLDK